MKDLNMLAWLTQLGLSVAVPLTCTTWLAVWLRQRLALGVWVIFVGLALGAVWAVQGFRHTLLAMDDMAKRMQKRTESSLNRKEE